MRCYHWQSDELTRGIKLHRGHTLSLGVTARTGARCWVGLHRDNPARVDNDVMHEAYPFWVSPKNGGRFLVFAKPHASVANDDRVLIHVTTRGPAFRGRGWWSLRGEGETILAGVVSLERREWSEGLVIASPGTVIRLRPTHGDDDYAFVYPMSGEPHVESWIRHEARQLLIETGVSTT